FEAIKLPHQQATRLRKSFDNQRIGHDRKTGEVVVQVLFGQGEVLDGLGLLATFEFDKFVDPDPAHGKSISLVETCSLVTSRRSLHAVRSQAEPGNEFC